MKNIISDLKKLGIVQVLFTTTVISTTIMFITVGIDVDRFNIQRLAGILTIALLFVITLFLIDSVDSLLKSRDYIDPLTNQILIKKLWRDSYTNPIAGLVVIIISAYGISSAQELSEVYKSTVSYWHDIELWHLEEDLFLLLRDHLFDVPWIWDNIYFSLWAYLMIAYTILYKYEMHYYFSLYCLTTIIGFFLTRIIALEYPTAGPAFYRPDFFNITGTTSAKVQEMLIAYMNGEIRQNGFIPGTMGIPSLHVGLTFLATGLLARQNVKSLIFTIPFTTLTWLSTIMLGWHYLLDGLFGVITISVSFLIARLILKINQNSFYIIRKSLFTGRRKL